MTERADVTPGQTLPFQFAQSLSQSHLVINVKCASCHDSFIDRWKLDEADGLAAIYADKPLLIHRCDIPTGETAKAAWLFPEIGQIEQPAAKGERLKQPAALMTPHENGHVPRPNVKRLLANHNVHRPSPPTADWHSDSTP